jgi:hypothetical protein
MSEVQMDARILDGVLATDSRIRYVGVLGGDLKTIASKTREDVKFEAGKGYVDDLLVNLAAPVVLGTLGRFTDKCGKLICAGVRFDKVTLMFFKLGELHVVVLTEPGPPYIIMQKLEEKFQV